MKKKFYQSEKFQGYFFPILYFILSIAIVVTASIIFKNKYYKYILIDGPSMRPTLVGGGSSGQTITKDGHTYAINYRSHYGYADLHQSAVNNLKRFDVCITSYPSSWISDDDSSIIKRVWGFPGETLTMTFSGEDTSRHFTFEVCKGEKRLAKYEAPIVNINRKFEGEYFVGSKRHILTISETYEVAKFNVGSKTFYTNFSNPTSKRLFTKTLQKNEYFVMGDNWGMSSDSYENRNNPDLLTKKYLQGKVACIDSYATAKGDEAIEIHKIKPKIDF